MKKVYATENIKIINSIFIVFTWADPRVQQFILFEVGSYRTVVG